MEKQDTNAENQKSQMRKGTLEFSILLIIAKGNVYASDILEELKASDLIVVEGTLYPLLSRLRAAELISYNWQESELGPPRKYYSLTDKGRATLKQLKENWKMLQSSIDSLIKKHEKNH